MKSSVFEGGPCEPSSRQCSPAIFLCKDSSCLASAFSSNCCDCEGPSPPAAPHQPLDTNERPPGSPPSPKSEMDHQQTLELTNARRVHPAYPVHHALQGPYSALPGSLFGRYPSSMTQLSPSPNLSLPITPGHCALAECPPDCHEPCTPGCDDLTDQCTPDCVQVAVPCLDSCAIPTKDCSPDTCPEILSEHTVWAGTDWHAHCSIPPQFVMNNDVQLGEDLQRLVNFAFYITPAPELTSASYSSTVVQTSITLKMTVVSLCQ